MTLAPMALESLQLDSSSASADTFSRAIALRLVGGVWEYLPQLIILVVLQAWNNDHRFHLEQERWWYKIPKVAMLLCRDHGQPQSLDRQHRFQEG